MGDGTGADISGNVITLHFVDGQRGDSDGEENGVIVDPGGPGYFRPTVITLVSFIPTPGSNQVILTWKTASEIDTAGFNLYRAESADVDYRKINSVLIPAKGSSTQGASYEFIDKEARNRKTYYYKLEDIDLSGVATMHGPASATPRLIFGIGK